MLFVLFLRVVVAHCAFVLRSVVAARDGHALSVVVVAARCCRVPRVIVVILSRGGGCLW